jgi:peptidoglycan/LPS O-acetylase OafA/YrhL
MGWTWYLGNDFIFAIVGILLLNLFHRSHAKGWLVTVFLAIASFIVTWLIIWQYNLTIIDNPGTPRGADYQYYLYDKPYSRIPAYLVGFAVPWILLWAKQKYGLERGSQPLTTRAFILVRCAVVVALGLIFFLLFITYTNQPGGFGHESKKISNWGKIANDIYLTFGRPLWAAAHAVLVVACYFDYIPLINSVLAHPVWAPLTKLTYNAYLLHPLIVNWRCGLAVQYYPFTVFMVLQNMACDTALAFVAAAIAWCLVEKPASTLTGFLLGKPATRSRPSLASKDLPVHFTISSDTPPCSARPSIG